MINKEEMSIEFFRDAVSPIFSNYNPSQIEHKNKYISSVIEKLFDEVAPGKKIEKKSHLEDRVFKLLNSERTSEKEEVITKV